MKKRTWNGDSSNCRIKMGVGVYILRAQAPRLALHSIMLLWDCLVEELRMDQRQWNKHGNGSWIMVVPLQSTSWGKMWLLVWTQCYFLEDIAEEVDTLKISIDLWLIFSGFRYLEGMNGLGIIHCRQKYGSSLTFFLVIQVSIWLLFLRPLTQCMPSFVKEKVSCIAYGL